ncbi:NAD(P)/FAD-dependent oxidoreductase [Ancylobacter defluvii]|uniref:FAD-dependent oxidoreductase n=1 Tax=Ancylobacter defluvii TaxID=1282440 RepID=A0A9W6NAN7_9HYPH|nr:FAD-binding oxidoreductase [Ancylobacter defluvii]MBS7588523.1 FAD-binding oxidoreductase [Ancylobacter defluvii]GLK83803.1 FAD-dependent oxidoreductase [Ancylobacter defluvii]
MATPHTGSYYAATAKPYAPFPCLTESVEADVCIVGGGFTGINTALELAERGLKVVVLEANRIGWGATGRNGGQITGSLSGDVAMGREFRRTLGAAADDYIWNLRWRGHAIIRERVARYAIDCDLKHGHLQAATKKVHVGELKAMHAEAVARGMGEDVSLVEGEALASLIEVPIYLAGLHNRRNMHVHSLNLVIGEAVAAAGLGVRIFEDSEVTRLTPGKRPVVETAQGRVTADTVMLAGNAYHRLGRGKMRGVLFPASLGILATAPLDEATARAINPLDIAVYDNRFVLDYHRLTADRRLIFGGGTNYSGRDSADIAAELRPALERTYPRLKGVGIDFQWSGKAGIIANRIPHLGRVAPNIFYAEGYSGHGIATTHIVAEIMARAITGTMGEFDVFDAVRRLRLPMGAWLAHQSLALGMWYYTLRERLR